MRRSCVVSSINNLIAENIEIPNYKPINLKETTVNYQTAHLFCGKARRIMKWAIPLYFFGKTSSTRAVIFYVL